MQNRSFTNLLWESTISTWGPIVTILGLLATVISWFVVPAENSVEVRWLLVSLFSSLLLIIIFARAAWEANSQQNFLPPKVIYVKEPPNIFPNACALLLIEPTPVLSYDEVVSIYYLEDGLERLVGVGKVINIQNDHKIQVIIFSMKVFEEKVELIKNNSQDELKKLIIKSSIPGIMVEGIMND